MLFQFILFAILGWVAFAPPATGNGKLILTIIFVVLMLLWLVAGFTGWEGINIPKR